MQISSLSLWLSFCSLNGTIWLVIFTSLLRNLSLLQDYDNMAIFALLSSRNLIVLYFSFRLMIHLNFLCLMISQYPL